MSLNELEPPEGGLGEFCEKTLKGLVSMIPGIGGFLSEYMDYYLPNNLNKRRNLFLQEVASKLTELGEASRINIESLKNNEIFISVLYCAIKESLLIHEREKREYLKAAVINTALEVNIKEDLQQRFISVISQLTQSHIQLLNFLEITDIDKIDKYEDLYALCVNTFLGSRDEFRMLCKDLMSHSLINISQDFGDFDDVSSSSKIILGQSQIEAPFIKITSIGQCFLQYINSNE